MQYTYLDLESIRKKRKGRIRGIYFYDLKLNEINFDFRYLATVILQVDEFRDKAIDAFFRK